MSNDLTPPPLFPAGMPSLKKPPKSPWYIGVDGEPSGPFMDDQVRVMVGAGQIKGSTQVWKEGMPDWQAASQTPDFSPLLTIEPTARIKPAAASPSTGSRAFVPPAIDLPGEAIEPFIPRANRTAATLDKPSLTGANPTQTVQLASSVPYVPSVRYVPTVPVPQMEKFASKAIGLSQRFAAYLSMGPVYPVTRKRHSAPG